MQTLEAKLVALLRLWAVKWRFTEAISSHSIDVHGMMQKSHLKTSLIFSEKCRTPDVDCVELPKPTAIGMWIFNHVGK